MYHSCMFPTARQHVLVQLGELASCWRLEAKVLRGALEVFWLSPGGMVLSSFGRVPFPGPGIKLREPLSPRLSHDGIAYGGSGAASSLPIFLLQEKNQHSLIFFSLLI